MPVYRTSGSLYGPEAFQPALEDVRRDPEALAARDAAFGVRTTPLAEEGPAPAPAPEIVEPRRRHRKVPRLEDAPALPPTTTIDLREVVRDEPPRRRPATKRRRTGSSRESLVARLDHCIRVLRAFRRRVARGSR